METAALDLAARRQIAARKQQFFDDEIARELGNWQRHQSPETRANLDTLLGWAKAQRLSIPPELEKRGGDAVASNPDKAAKKLPKRLRKLLPGRSFLPDAPPANLGAGQALPRLQLDRSNEPRSVEMELYA